MAAFDPNEMITRFRDRATAVRNRIEAGPLMAGPNDSPCRARSTARWPPAFYADG